MDHQQTVHKDLLPGLHPMELNADKKAHILQYIRSNELSDAAVHFYGAGCESDFGKEQIIQFLNECQLREREVQTDIYGACKALLGNQPGTVGILGTGAVAVRYDGVRITQQASGWGYILGDEGSGFDIGKRVVQAYLRNEFDDAPAVKTTIENYFGGSNRIIPLCSQPNARFTIAGLTREINPHSDHPVIRQILTDAFTDFYKTAILPLSADKEVNLVGSVAYHLQDEVAAAFRTINVNVARVECDAIDRLHAFVVRP